MSMLEVETAHAAPVCTSGTRDHCMVTWLLCIGRPAEDTVPLAHDSVGVQLRCSSRAL